jgi:arabinogalactan oligomer / maltooligosaccharide transport system substrate-binding protein
VSVALVWGNVPQWVSACSSLFALAFAAVAVVATRRTLRIERERDRINTEARAAQEFSTRRAQAALVSAWWGQSHDGRWGAFLRNSSEAPIYQVYLTVLGSDDHSDGAKAHYVVVPPSHEALFCLIGVDLPLGASGHRVKLGFTDAGGVRWLRDQYGRLTELQPNMRIKVDPNHAAVLSQFQDDFLATYGVTIAFDTSDYPQDAFLADLQTSSAPDALVCPHDWIGDLIARDVVEPIILSADHWKAFPEWALAALSVGSSLYGLPMTVDTVALIRNTELVPRHPTTFDELITMGTTLRDKGRVDEVFAVRVGARGDPFQIWPLFTSAGGWLFGHAANGEWDSTQIGLATPESIAALNRLRELGEAGTGMLRRSMDRTEAIELFTSGRSPFLLTTSDAMPMVDSLPDSHWCTAWS